MNIVCFFDAYWPDVGGAEILYQRLCEHWARSGHQVTVVTSGKQRQPFREVVGGVTLRRAPRVPRWMQSFAGYRLAVREVSAADLVVCSTYASAWAAFWFARRKKLKTVVIVHEVLYRLWKRLVPFSFLYRWYEKGMLRLGFDRYVAVSDSTKQELIGLGIGEARIDLIYNGVDLDRFTPRPLDRTLRLTVAGSTDPLILYFGRPGVTKGVSFLLRAVVGLSNDYPGLKLCLLLGRTPVSGYRRVRREIKSLELTERILLLDPLERNVLPDYVNLADVVVIPSLSEGFGFSALEAASLDKKLVISRAGALPEVAFGRVTWVEPGNVASLAKGVQKSLENDYVVVEPKKFLWEDCFQRYDRIINEMFV